MICPICVCKHFTMHLVQEPMQPEANPLRSRPLFPDQSHNKQWSAHIDVPNSASSSKFGGSLIGCPVRVVSADWLEQRFWGSWGRLWPKTVYLVFRGRKRYLPCWFIGPWADFLPATGVKTTIIPFYGDFDKEMGQTSHFRSFHFIEDPI